MKSYSISFFLFALNVYVSANPLIKRLVPFGGTEPNPFGTPSPDGGLLAPTNPNSHEGETCSVRLEEFQGFMKPRGECNDLSIAGYWFLFGRGFAADKERQLNDPHYHDLDQQQCCIKVSCSLSNGDDGYCTNNDKKCQFGTGQEGRCPGYNTKCCNENASSKSSSSLPTFDDLLASGSNLNPVDSNALFPAGDLLAFNPDDANNELFTTGDGTTPNPDFSTFYPDDSSQISYDLIGSPLLGDDGTTLVGLNDGSASTNLFASVEGDESSLDFFS